LPEPAGEFVSIGTLFFGTRNAYEKIRKIALDSPRMQAYFDFTSRRCTALRSEVESEVEVDVEVDAEVGITNPGGYGMTPPDQRGTPKSAAWVAAGFGGAARSFRRPA
jgi:hypothetical protein